MTDRTRARALARQFVDAGTPLDWFEVLYDEAAVGSAAIPWADLRPNPNLVAWLDRSRVNGDGRRALVVGCGYGDDAEELASRGFDVTAFDISPTAIAKCHQRFPNSAVRYEVADLQQPPPSWQQQFEFVFEAYTLQVLPPDIRAKSIAKIADFVNPGGSLLVVTRARDTTDPPGQMPWPLLRDELAEFSPSLREMAFEDFHDDEQPPVRRFRVEYRRFTGELNKMAAEMNHLRQLIGPIVADWKEPLFPARAPMLGRCCRLEPLDAARHAASLFAANSLDERGLNWTYLPYGPFERFDEYRDWLDQQSRLSDPLFFAIIDLVSNEAVGVASYLRITPTSGSIEVGHLNFSPRLQRTPAATEAMFLMMARAFELGYRRYEWKCNALNESSRQAAERLGLSFEGIFRQAAVVKGRNRDTAWYAAIDSEWSALRAAFQTWLDPANFDERGQQRVRLSDLTASVRMSLPMTKYTQSDELTVLQEPFVRGLGEIRIAHPAGTFAITPASLISLEAIANNQQLLAGVGLDWGSGVGCLAIAAARIPAVQRVIGLELSAANVTVARQNAAANRVDRKTTFFESDSYAPISAGDRRELESLAGQIDFVVANPPASDGDDGFGWRRRVLAGASKYLNASGRVFLSVSSQYGMRRVMGLLDDARGFRYGGLLASTEWVPFDLARPDLLECLRLYAQEEGRGGLSYAFHDPASGDQTATAALERFDRCGQSPLMKWQTHLFEVTPTVEEVKRTK